MISTYSMGLYYGLGWTLIESYYRPYGRAFLKGRLAWLEAWMLYLVWGALLLGPNLVAGGLLIGLGMVNASLGKLLKPKQVSLLMALLLFGASLYAAKAGWTWPYHANWLWTALYALWFLLIRFSISSSDVFNLKLRLMTRPLKEQERLLGY